MFVDDAFFVFSEIRRSADRGVVASTGRGEGGGEAKSRAVQ